MVGHVTEYSDTLLTFLLKANAPEKYRERVQIDHGLVESVAAQLGVDPADVLREVEANHAESRPLMAAGPTRPLLVIAALAR